MDTKDLLSPEDAAKMIGLSPRTIVQYMTTRRIGYVIVNNRRYLTKEQVQDYIDRKAFKVVQPA